MQDAQANNQASSTDANILGVGRDLGEPVDVLLGSASTWTWWGL